MNAVVQFQAPRLPYHDAIAERFNVDKGAWKVLVESVFPAAKSPDAVVMALSYCKRRNLDIFKRPVHIVPMWDKKRNDYVETVWPGISELRTTAFRTGQYAGCDETEFGPDVTRTFEGTTGKGQYEQHREVEVTFPEWGRMTVWRMVNSVRVPFVGPKVYWLESYGKIGKTELPNDMWEKRPRGQLEKCLEAAALRKAFPEEIGNELTAEEMAGQVILDQDAQEVAERLKPVVPAAPAVPSAPQIEHRKSEPVHVPLAGRARKAKEAQPEPAHDPETGEIVDDESHLPEHMRSSVDMEARQRVYDDADGGGPVEDETPASEAPIDQESMSFDEATRWRDDLLRILKDPKITAKAISNIERTQVLPKEGDVPDQDYADVVKAVEAARRRVSNAGQS